MGFKLSLRSVVIGFIGGFFAIQIISLLLSTLFPSIPVLAGGPAILIMLLAIAIMTLFIVGTNVDQLRKRESLVFVLIVFGLVAVAYWKLPETFPSLFSISPEVSNVIKQTVGSVLGGFS